MPVQMIASRRYYRREDRKEYKAGDSFLASDDREADKLTRVKKATRASDAVTAHPTKRRQATDLPPEVMTRAMRETPPLAPPTPVVEPGAPHPEPEDDQTAPRRRNYRRRDLQAEE